MFTWRICSECFVIIYLLVTLWRVRISLWESWLAVLLERKRKKKNEKTKRKEKRNREPPLRQQSKTDEADLFIRSHQNGRANVLNTAQDPLFCFGSTAIHPISGLKTFLLSYWAITRIWDFVPRLLGKNYPSQTARWTDIFKLGVAKPCTWLIQTN